MLTVKYASNGFKVADAAAEKWAKHIFNNYNKNRPINMEIAVANELIINVFRALVKENKIHYSDIQFSFGDIIIPVDKNGRISVWPKNFCDYNDKLLERLLQT